MSKKRIIAIVTVIVLLFAAGISVGVFLYGRGETEAADGSQTTIDGNQVVDGNQSTEGTQTGESTENPTINPDTGDETTTTPDEENVAGADDDETVDNDNVVDEDVPVNVDNDNVAGDAGDAGNAEVTTGTDVNEVGETTITRVEEEERLISEAFWDWWHPMEVAITPTDIGVQIPQITVKKAAITGVGGDQLIYAGQDITYVIAITNNGETDVENIEVTDKIPQNTTFVSIDDAILLGETVGTKTTVGTENEVAGVKWVVSIPAGETVIAKFTVNVNEEVTGTILNTATANGEESNEVKTSIIRTNKSSIVTRNNEQVETAKIGDLITYKITVENTGEVEGTTYITDTIPAGTEFVSAQEGAIVTKSVDTTVIWSVNVPAGESVTREFTVKVTSIDGEIKNIADVGGTPTNEDIVETANITVNKNITKITRKVNDEDTYLDLEDENLAVKEGDIIEYTILVTNTGSLDLTNVVLDEKLEGIILLNEEDLVIGDLPAGKTVEITATYTVTYEADIKNKEDREIYNEVYVSGETVPENPEEEPEKVEDNDDETVEVEEVPSWKVEKIADKTSEVKAGETIHYIITVTNTGNVKLSNIPVSDIITIKDSEGNTLETISDVKLYEEYKIDENNTDVYRKEITTIPELAVEGSKTLYASYTVKQTDVDNNVEITNIAYANEQPSEEVITTLEKPVPGILVEKEAKQVKRNGEFIDIKDAGKVRTGEVVKYEIKVTNTGNTTLTNVEITDTLNIKVNDENAEITIAGTPIKVVDEMLPNSNPVIITTYYTVDENDMKNEKINNIATGTAETPVTPTTPEGTITDNDDEEIVVNPNTSMAVIKIWDDADNQDGKRKDSVTVQLKADEENYGDAVELNDSNEWKKEWNTLPKYNGENVISYTVVETKIGNEDVVENKTTYYTSTQVTEGNTVTITNTHTPETVKVEGSKTWDDANNQDGKRPSSITIRLLADETEINSAIVTATENWAWSFTDLPKYKEGKEIVYTIAEDAVADYETSVSGYNVTNKHTPETVTVEGSKTWDDANNQDGKRPSSITIRVLADGTEVKSATVTATDYWSWSFANLPKYKDGKEIVYTITEDAVADYETAVSGYNVTNKHTPETVKVEGSKIWDDADNQDGKRPTSIIIRLLADGTEVKTATVTEAENWAWTFTDLPKYKDGKEIVYTITEDAVEAYETTVNGYNVTNTHTPETVNVEGSKTWDDANNQDGKRPSSITIRLLADGEEVNSATVTSENDWSWLFENLPVYKAGKEIVYTITEDAVTGYETTISGYNVTNKHVPETTSVSGTKTWDDADNQDGKRPSSITIRLLADEEEVNSATVTAAESWAWSFTDLPKYKEGKEIVYTITEDAVADYETSVSGYNVTNKHTPETVTVEGSKTWDDADNQDGKRPSSITIRLLADGTEINSATVTEAENWAWTFTDLPKYEDGKEIVYTIAEDTVTGYETTISGYNVTNTHTPETVKVEGSKIWDDANNQDGKRPSSITIRVLADGTEVKSATVTATDYWSWSFANLPKYKDGKEIVYTITEDTVTGYETTVSGYDVTNTHTPETVKVEGSKTWEDADNQDGKRPSSITIRLLADGTEVNSATVTAAENWAWSFTDLPKYKDGKEIVYTISEDTVADYETTVSGYNVTNSYTPAETQVSVTKVWNDNNNKEGIRPESITVTLLADGTEVGEIDLSEANNWTYTFTELPVNKAGEEIVYTVSEPTVPEGYTSETTGDAATGYTITNTNARAVISAEKLVSVNEADVVATQSGTDVVREGAILTYIISVANHGVVDQNVLIKDEIPAGTTFVNESIKIDDIPYTEYDETDLAAGIEVLVPANTDEVTLSFNVVVTGNNETDVTSGIATVDGEQVSIVKTNAIISNYAARPGSGNQGGSSSSTTIDHIDIGIAATADVYDSYGNLHEDVKVTLTSTQIANAVFTATQDGKSVSFTKNSGTGTSTDSNGNSQIRIEGTFPVGTVDSPVIYTVTVEASVSVKNTTTGETETIPVTLTGSMSYWDYESNNCPGLGNRTEWTTVIGGSGLDMTLGGGNSPTGTLTIQKIVSGYAFEADKTFTFTVTDEKGETKTYTATVKAGETTATVTITGLEFGTYTVTETMSDAGVDGYTVTASYKVNETEGNAVTLAAGEETYNGTVLVTNTYEQETTNAPIYNTAYVYDEDGNLLVETNEVVIYVKTTDSSAYGTQETETVSTFSLRAAYQVAYTYGIDVYEEDDNSTDVVEPVEIPTSETDEQEEIATPETKEQEEITTPESESQDDSTIEDEKRSETVQEDITENVEEQGKSDEEVVIEDVPVENEKKEESSSTTENDKSLSNTNSEKTITEKSNDLSENKTETLTETVQE